MPNLRNFVGCSTSTVGTGSLNLGAAMPGHRTFDASYTTTTVVSYTIVDGLARETGQGTFDKSQNLLSRTTLYDTTTGSKLNLSGNAIVFVDMLAQDYTGDWPVLIVSRNAGNSNGFQSVGSNFTTVWLTDVSVDTHGGWQNEFQSDPYTWIVPQTGLYDIQGKIRPVDTDNQTAAYNFGVGVDVGNQDSAGFVWQEFPTGSQNNNNRFTGYNSRQMMLTVGQSLRLFSYIDRNSNMDLNKAELVATRVR